jgi:hypothetical protein
VGLKNLCTYSVIKNERQLLPHCSEFVYGRSMMETFLTIKSKYVYTGQYYCCSSRTLLVVYIAIGVGLDQVKSNRHEDPMAVNNNQSGYE